MSQTPNSINEGLLKVLCTIFKFKFVDYCNYN